MIMSMNIYPLNKTLYLFINIIAFNIIYLYNILYIIIYNYIIYLFIYVYIIYLL